jgi:hypothetical protein
MTVKNFPGPYELAFVYNVTVAGTTLSHVQSISCDITGDPAVGTTFPNIQIKRRGLADVALDNVVESWLDLLEPIYNDSNTSLVGVNLFKYQTDTFVKDFVSSYNGSFTPSATGAVNPAGQQTLTFRTQEGGRFRLTFLETSQTLRGIDASPLADSSMTAIVSFVIGTGNWMLGRDTSYPVSFIRQLGGENESTFRRRYRF